jgi:hypothetical protein
MLLYSARAKWMALAASIAFVSAFFLCEVRSMGGEPLIDGLLGTNSFWDFGWRPDSRDRRLYVRPRIFDRPAPSDGNQSGSSGAVKAPGFTTYKVPPGGKLIGEVAQEQLGSSLRWIDIYRWNTSLDVSQSIPEKTEIRIPPR